MNLKEIRSGISSITNFKPTNTDHLLDMDYLINLAYQETWLARPWTFAQKLVYMNVIPDITYDQFPANINLTDFSRRIQFSVPIRVLGIAYDNQYIELQGRDYLIQKVVSTSELQLAEPFRGTSEPDNISWKLKIKTYTLPDDLVQVCSLAHRDWPVASGQRQYIPGISSHTEEQLGLQVDRTANIAQFYFYAPPDNILSGEKLATFVPDPIVPSTLAVGSYYEFCWAFAKGTSLGPLSEPLIAQSTENEEGGVAVGNAIGLNPYTHDDVLVVTPAFDLTVDKAPNVWEGLRKVLFVNTNFNHVTGERLGIPRWVHVTQYNGAPGQYDSQPYGLADVESGWVIRYLEQLSPGNKPYIEVDGHHSKVRFYPRINSYDYRYLYHQIEFTDPLIFAPEEFFKQVELRYLYKPKALTCTTDAPEMPYELHTMIIYKTLDNYYTKIGNAQLAQLYRQRYESDLQRAEKKYIEQGNIRHQRQSQFGNNLLFMNNTITYRTI